MYSAADDALVEAIAYDVPLEPAELRLWSLLAPGADLVMDIGANTGLYSLLTSAKAPGARVFAFEPHPPTAARLRRNIGLNGAGRVEVIESAVGDREGQITLYVPEDDRICLVSSVDRAFAESWRSILRSGPFKACTLPQTTIDAFVASRELGRVDLIKVDVESHELAVLRGAEQTLLKDHPSILCEVCDPEVAKNQRPDFHSASRPDHCFAIEDLLRRHGYEFYLVSMNGLLRVNDLRSSPGGLTNYVFGNFRSDERFISWDELASIEG
jgi:FkbM family methyltransferase